MSEPLSTEERLCRKLGRLTKDATELRKLNRKLLRRGGGYDSFVEELQEVLKAEKAKPFVWTPTHAPEHTPLSVAPVSGEHKETATIMLSDWHLSEVIREEESNGINKYNTIIAANRVYDLMVTVKRIIRLHQAMYPIEELWFPILGDMIHGSIHPDFITSNDLSDPAAAILCARLLRAFLHEMTEFVIPIRVDCVVGNHPRMTEKLPTKRIAYSSFDWVVYEMLADYFYGNPLVDVNIHTGQLALVKRYGFNYVLEHGVSVKSGHEEEYEDRVRALFDDPTYRRATGWTGAAFDQILIGNLHKSRFLERTIVNGALTGQNELGQAWRLKPILACQNMFGISKHHFRTWQYVVDLTDAKSDKPTNPFSKYAAEYLKRHGN